MSDGLRTAAELVGIAAGWLVVWWFLLGLHGCQDPVPPQVGPEGDGLFHVVYRQDFASDLGMPEYVLVWRYDGQRAHSNDACFAVLYKGGLSMAPLGPVRCPLVQAAQP